MAKEFRRGSKYEGFAKFSATPPLELVKLIISFLATAQRDPVSWFGWREHGTNDQIAMMHTEKSRAYFHATFVRNVAVGIPRIRKIEGVTTRHPRCCGKLGGCVCKSFDGTRLCSWEPQVRVHSIPKNVASRALCMETISCLEARDRNWNGWKKVWTSTPRRSTL